MYILTIRTDKQEAELGLYNDHEQLVYQKWEAHRALAETINTKIIDVLTEGNVKLHELAGIVGYKGPGSFTGLRIGLSVANALAYSLQIPVVTTTEDDWLEHGISRLVRDENERIGLPLYGAEPNITVQKH
jgi:tRNA threonylcarbamoyladenosine biosynthesis protein TsaB